MQAEQSLIITGTQAWRDLKDTIVDATILHMDHIGGCPPYTPKPQFPNVTILYVMYCDKNFVYHWIKPEYYPKLTTVYLYSHPCQWDALKRFLDYPSIKIYLFEHYYNHYIIKRNWIPEKYRLVQFFPINLVENENTF